MRKLFTILEVLCDPLSKYYKKNISNEFGVAKIYFGLYALDMMESLSLEKSTRCLSYHMYPFRKQFPFNSLGFIN